MENGLPDSMESLRRERDALLLDNARLQEQIGVFESCHQRHMTAEKAFSENEERLRLALDATQDGIWDWNILTGNATFTPRCYAMLGYEHNEFPPTFDSWASIAHPDDIERTMHSIKGHLERGEKYATETRMRTKSGKWHWILTRGMAVQWDDLGKPVRMVGTHTDIEERKQFEEALRDSEAHLREAQKLAHLGSWSWDCDSGRMNWSEELYRIAGRDLALSPPDLQEYLNFYTSDSRERYLGAVSHTLASGDPFEVELELIRHDGMRRIIINRGAPSRDAGGQTTGIYGTIHDVTEQKVAEEERIRNEKMYRALFERMTSGAVVYEAVNEGDDFIIRDFNPAAESIEHVNKELLIGKPVTEVFAGIRDFGIFTVFQRVWKTGTPEYFPEALYRDSRDVGTWRENWVYKLPTGEIVAIYNDITARKEADEKLKASLREKDVLLKEVHHRVKNNLQLLSSLVNIQTEHSDMPGASPLSEGFLAFRNRLKAMTLLYELLYHEGQLAHLNFCRFLESVIASLHFSYGRDNIDYQVQCDDISLELAQAVPLSFIITELMTNAFKHAFAEDRAGMVAVSLLGSRNDDVLLTVRDNGRGFPAGNPSTRSVGLELVSELVEQLNGTMEIIGGNGTTVTVRFRRIR